VSGASREQERASALEGRMDVLVSYVLLGGVLTAVLFVVVGLAWHWLNTGQLGVDYRISGMNLFEFVVDDLRQVGSAQLRPRLLVSIGIAALMLTPYLRVFASLLFFAFAEHNWKYVAFTGFVLSVLTYSLFLR